MKNLDLTLQIANCRGKKPVINALKKHSIAINDLLIEMNSCEGRELIREATNILYKVLEANK